MVACTEWAPTALVFDVVHGGLALVALPTFPGEQATVPAILSRQKPPTTAFGDPLAKLKAEFGPSRPQKDQGLSEPLHRSSDRRDTSANSQYLSLG